MITSIIYVGFFKYCFLKLPQEFQNKILMNLKQLINDEENLTQLRNSQLFNIIMEKLNEINLLDFIEIIVKLIKTQDLKEFLEVCLNLKEDEIKYMKINELLSERLEEEEFYDGAMIIKNVPIKSQVVIRFQIKQNDGFSEDKLSIFSVYSGSGNTLYQFQLANNSDSNDINPFLFSFDCNGLMNIQYKEESKTLNIDFPKDQKSIIIIIRGNAFYRFGKIIINHSNNNINLCKKLMNYREKIDLLCDQCFQNFEKDTQILYPEKASILHDKKSHIFSDIPSQIIQKNPDLHMLQSYPFTNFIYFCSNFKNTTSSMNISDTRINLFLISEAIRKTTDENKLKAILEFLKMFSSEKNEFFILTLYCELKFESWMVEFIIFSVTEPLNCYEGKNVRVFNWKFVTSLFENLKFQDQAIQKLIFKEIRKTMIHQEHSSLYNKAIFKKELYYFMELVFLKEFEISLAELFQLVDVAIEELRDFETFKIIIRTIKLSFFKVLYPLTSLRFHLSKLLSKFLKKQFDFPKSEACLLLSEIIWLSGQEKEDNEEAIKLQTENKLLKCFFKILFG